MKYCGCKEIDVLVRKMVRDGWTYSRGGKHGKLRDRFSRVFLTVPVSPSDYRAVLNFKRDLRRLCRSSAN
jgi:hypothetical protein